VHNTTVNRIPTNYGPGRTEDNGCPWLRQGEPRETRELGNDGLRPGRKAQFPPQDYCTALHCSALHCSALHCTPLWIAAAKPEARMRELCSALHSNALEWVVLHCTALHCTALVREGTRRQLAKIKGFYFLRRIFKVWATLLSLHCTALGFKPLRYIEVRDTALSSVPKHNFRSKSVHFHSKY
jgi:hypothetical protein